MILSGQAIIEEVLNGNISITPFDEAQVSPNSYNYRLDNHISYFDSQLNILIEKVIPSEGLKLVPQQLYLANSLESIKSAKYFTILIGRSSVGRLGLFVQVSSDYNELTCSHTLELRCVQPIIVYPYMAVGQVSFWGSEK